MSQSLQEYVIRELEKHNFKCFDGFSSKEMLSMVFINYRKVKEKHTGLRLTYLGNRYMSKVFENYAYENNETVNSEILLNLDRHMQWPYYVTNQHVVFYSNMDAAWFQLNGQRLGEYTDYI